MYVNLAVKFSDFDKENPKNIVQYYRINDTLFKHDFSAIYLRDKKGVLDDVHHINQLLYGIYYAYKFSSQPICKNFKLVMKNTFNQALSQIIKTSFYKEHKNLIDKSAERKTNAYKY